MTTCQYYEVRDAYRRADELGLTGFDIDMTLTQDQNLDMCIYGFEAGENAWVVYA